MSGHDSVVERLEARLLLSHTWQGFLPEQAYPAGEQPTSVVCYDFDSDGNIDVAVTNNTSNTVSILMGNGDGTLRAKQDFAAGTSPHGLGYADFNGDGFVDLVVGHGNQSYISVLWGDVDGTFSAPQTLTAGSSALGVAVADINNDGRPDIVSVNRNDNTVSLILRNANGTFTAKQDLAAGDGSPTAVRIADVNADGKQDLLVYTEDNYRIMLLLGNTPGTFLAPVQIDANTRSMGMAVVDVNADGHLDIVAADFSFNALGTLLGNGAGVFQSAGLTIVAHGLALAVGDVDGDGYLDALTSHVEYALGNGDGTFDAPQGVPTSNRVDTIALADLNGDGWLDSVAANWNENNISVLLNTGDPNIAPVAVDDTLDVPQGVAGTVAVTANDTDAEGDFLSLNSLGSPSHGSLMMVGNSVRYDPTPGYVGSDSFTYTVRDGYGGTDVGTVNVRVLLPVEVGTNGVTQAIYTDADGTTVTVTPKGAAATLYFFGDSFIDWTPDGGKASVADIDTDGRVELVSIALPVAGVMSSLTVKTAGGDGLAQIGTITGSVRVKKLSAATTDLTGDGIVLEGDGYAASVTVHDLTGEADILMEGQGASKGVSIRAGLLDGYNEIILGSGLKSIRLAQADGGQIRAPWIGSLSVTGDSKRATPLPGNFDAGINTGPAGIAPVLKSVSIAGGMSYSNWNITGIIGKITVAGRVTSSHVYAELGMGAVSLGAVRDSDFLAGVAAAHHAMVHGDFQQTSARIASITIKGLAGAAVAERFVENSSFSAASMGKVRLLNMETVHPAADFGLYAWDAAEGSEIASVTAKDTNAPADPLKNWTWSPAAPLNDIDAFQIRIL